LLFGGGTSAILSAATSFSASETFFSFSFWGFLVGFATGFLPAEWN
jgi:hypothetical protein